MTVGVTVVVGVIVFVGVTVGVSVVVGVGVGVGVGTEYTTSNKQFSFVFCNVIVDEPNGIETRTPKLFVKSE